MTSVVNFIPSKFGSFPQGVLKVVRDTRLNVYRERSGDSWFGTKNLLIYYKWSQTRSISCTNSILHLNFISASPIPIQNNIHCWSIETKKRTNYNLYDNIRELSKTTFWCYRNNIKRKPGFMLCLHCSINDSSDWLHITVYIAVISLGSCHTGEGN